MTASFRSVLNKMLHLFFLMGTVKKGAGYFLEFPSYLQLYFLPGIGVGAVCHSAGNGSLTTNSVYFPGWLVKSMTPPCSSDIC